MAHLDRAEDIAGQIIRKTTFLSRTFHAEKASTNQQRVVPTNTSLVALKELTGLNAQLIAELKERQADVFQSFKVLSSSYQANKRNKYRYLVTLVRQVDRKTSRELQRIQIWFARSSGSAPATGTTSSSMNDLPDDVLLAKLFNFSNTMLRRMREIVDEMQEISIDQGGFAGEELNIKELIQSFAGKEKLLIKIQSMVRSFIQRSKFIRLVAKHKGSSSSLVQRQRLRVVKEIASTESTYVSSILFCITNFYKPMKEEANKPNGVLSPEELSLIFGSIHVISKVNSEFLDEIEARVQTWPQTQKIGDIFVTKAPTLKLYMGYVNNFDQSTNTLAQCLARPDFAAFLQKITETAQSQPLSSYLIMPIQRLPRYEMLLKTLLSYLDEQHVDRDTVSEALRLITGINAEVNRKKANADNINLIIKLQKQIEGEPMPLVVPSRKFIKQGEAVVLSSAKFLKDNDQKTLFMFNDLLIWTEKEDGIFASLRQSGSGFLGKFQRQKTRSGSSSALTAVPSPAPVRYKYKGHLSIVSSVELKPLDNELSGCGSSSDARHGFSLDCVQNKKEVTINFLFPSETEANSWSTALKVALKSERLRELCCSNDEEVKDKSVCQNIRILLAAARNLPSVQSKRKGYVDSCALIKINGKEARSKIVHQSLNPVWNEILKLHIDVPENPDEVTVEIEIQHKSSSGVQKLCSATTLLSKLSVDQQSVVPLSPQGEIYITLSD